MTELRNTWALREVYFDEHGNPSMHREPVPMTDEPYGWAVTGCHSLYRGEWAEDTARSEAKRCGGTARAFPLYTHPAPGVPDDVVRDAERYRWLRDFDHWPAPFASSQEPEPVRGADLDAAIDAAIAKAEGREA